MCRSNHCEEGFVCCSKVSIFLCEGGQERRSVGLAFGSLDEGVGVGASGRYNSGWICENGRKLRW